MKRTYPSITTSQRYLDALGNHDPLESMRKAPKRVRKLLKGLSRKQLRRQPEEGRWSIHQALAHFADHEFVLGARVRMVASMERPPLVGYDQDAFVRELAHDAVETEQLLADFAAARAANVALLERLPAAAFERVGVHSERGDESLATMLFMYAGHDRMHEAQIQRVRDLVTGVTAAREREAKKAAEALARKAERRAAKLARKAAEEAEKLARKQARELEAAGKRSKSKKRE